MLVAHGAMIAFASVTGGEKSSSGSGVTLDKFLLSSASSDEPGVSYRATSAMSSRLDVYQLPACVASRTLLLDTSEMVHACHAHLDMVSTACFKV